MSTTAELAREYADLTKQINSLKERRDDIENRLCADMSEKTFELPGVGFFERRGGVTRKQYQHDDIKSALLRAVRDNKNRLVDQESGEILPEDDIERGVRALFEAANPSWRKGGLAKYDIDVDDYCNLTFGTPTIQFTGSTKD